MIYTEATMMLWPRLLHAARAINPAAADTLQEYMLKGGQFTPFGANLFPSGTMKAEEANRFKAERLQPLRPAIIQAINAAKAADHPWVPAVRAKWEALQRECEQRFESMKFALHQDPVQRVAEYATHLLDTAAATIMVGQALHFAGFDEYGERLLEIGTAHAELLAIVEQGKVAYDPLGKSVAIDTPDGRLWLVEWYGHTPEGWQEGEPRLLESDLGVALQKFDGVERWWLVEDLETRPKEQQQTA